MNKKAFALLQHWLIPTALLAGNMALVQLIYLLAQGNYGYSTILTGIAIIVLTTGILRPKKYLLLSGIIFYTIVLFLALL